MLLMATQEIHSIILTSLFLKWFDILFVWLICCCREILVYYPLEGWNVNQEIWKLLSLFFYYEIRTLRLVCQLCSKGEFWPCAQEVWIWLQTASQTLCGKLLTLQSYKAVLSPAHLPSQMGDWGWAFSSSALPRSQCLQSVWTSSAGREQAGVKLGSCSQSRPSCEQQDRCSLKYSLMSLLGVYCWRCEL